MVKLTEVYPHLHQDCPPHLWSEFEEFMKSCAQDYKNEITEQKLTEVYSQASKEEQELINEILTALSLKRLPQPENKYKQVMKKYNIPRPSSSLRTRIRVQPGAITKEKRAYEKIEHIKQEELNQEYLSGTGVFALSRKYKTHPDTIKKLITVPLRETDNNLNKKTLLKLQEKNNQWYHNAFNNHPHWSLKDLQDHVVKELLNDTEYSQKAILPYFKSIGLEVDEERQNHARRLKSRKENNTSYMIKKTTIDLIKKTHYKTVDNLTKKYCSGKIGTYSMIAKELNRELNTRHFTPRQIEKVIINNKHYIKRKSHSENIFINAVQQELHLKEKEVKRQWRYDNNSASTIDLYIPHLNLAIEFNGDYWHSTEVIYHNHRETAVEYHARKKTACEQRGVRLVYVWESDVNKRYYTVMKALTTKDYDHPILNKLENDKYKNSTRRLLKACGVTYDKCGEYYDCGTILVKDYSASKNNYSYLKQAREQGKELFTLYPWHDKNKVLSFLDYRLRKESMRIGARKTISSHSDKLTSEDLAFIEKNHILGSMRFRKIVGVTRLFYQSNLVGLAVFIQVNHDTVELKRLVFQHGYSITGGASKLLKAFEREYPSYTTMITFSDNNLSEGGVYRELGFTLAYESRGDKIWFNPKTGQKFTNKSLYLIGADRLLKNMKGFTPVGLGEDLPSNKEIVLTHGFTPIIDCGYKKWVKKIDRV